jgi:Bacteriophage clamp loader A subunit
MTPFDFVNAINSSKKTDLMTGTDNDELSEKAYVPFVVNRALSYFPDTLMYANAMNIHNILDNKLQFHYHLNSIRPGRRFSKWAKKDDSDIQLVMQYYNYGVDKARQALQLLSTEQLSIIRTKLQSGIQDEHS